MRAPSCGRSRRQTCGSTATAEAISSTVRFVLTNYALTFLLLGRLFAAIAIARAPKPVASRVVVEKLLSWYVFAVGAYFLYNFVMHGLFGAMTARVIGWADSPFQFEVATASLGFAVVGFIAASRRAPGSLVVTVRDDGEGLPAAPLDGLGLSGMRRRAASLGGSLTVDGADGGTRVELAFPAG